MRVVKLACVFLVLLCVMACNKVERTTVCTINYDGVDVVNTVVSSGKDVKMVTYQNTMVVEESLIPYMKTTVEEYAEKVWKIPGISYNYKFEDNVLVETTLIDYMNVNMQQLYELGLLEKVDGKLPETIDYEASIEGMRILGCECKEQ